MHYLKIKLLLYDFVLLVEILLSTLQASGYCLLEVLLGSFVILIENGEATTGIIYFGTGASLLQVLLCANLVTSVDGCKSCIQIGELIFWEHLHGCVEYIVVLFASLRITVGYHVHLLERELLRTGVDYSASLLEVECLHVVLDGVICAAQAWPNLVNEESECLTCLIREKVVTFRMVKLNMLLSIFLITK